MLSRLSAPHQDLIHILRHMMRTNVAGVLNRTWEFRCLFDEMPYSQPGPKPTDLQIFPEFGPDFPSDQPFQITGARLMERAVFISEGESVLVRLNDDSPKGYDLLFAIDGGHPIGIDTDDEPLCCLLEEWFAQTSQVWHRECFR